MANLSSAFGTLKICAPDRESLKKIFDILKRQEDWEYGTYFQELGGIKTGSPYGKVAEVAFDATGRWCYEENLRSLIGWLELPDDEKELLKKVAWKLVYEFKDLETGCEVFVQEKFVLDHEVGQSLSKIKYEVVECNELSIDAVTLYYEGMAENIDDALEILTDTSDPEYVAEHFERCVDNLWTYESLKGDDAKRWLFLNSDVFNNNKEYIEKEGC